MNDVGWPVKFSHRLNNSTREEHSAVVVILKQKAVFIGNRRLSLGKEIVIIDEINLNSGFLSASRFAAIVSVLDSGGFQFFGSSYFSGTTTG